MLGTVLGPEDTVFGQSDKCPSSHWKFYLWPSATVPTIQEHIFPASDLWKRHSYWPSLSFQVKYKIFLISFLIGCLGSSGHLDPANHILEQERAWGPAQSLWGNHSDGQLWSKSLEQYIKDGENHHRFPLELEAPQEVLWSISYNTGQRRMHNFLRSKPVSCKTKLGVKPLDGHLSTVWII